MRAVFEAFSALIEAVPNLPVYDTVIAEGEVRPPLYVVLFDQTPRHSGRTLDASAKTSVHTLSVMAVGTSPNEVRWAVEKTSAVLERTRLTVDARLSTPLKKIGSSSVLPDPDSVTQRIYTATDVWRCAFDRA